jgi:O-antigen/teichoic acid export membrane protein
MQRLSGAQRRYLQSFIDQGFLSAFHFTLGLVLVRAWEPAVFGVYAFWQAVAYFCVGIQNALVNTPLSVFAPACRTIRERTHVEGVLSSLNFALIASFLGIVIAFNFSFPMVERMRLAASLVIAAFVAGTLLREYTRSVAFGRQRPAAVLRTDGIHILIGCGVLAVYAIDPGRLDLLLVFGLLAIGSGIGGTAGLLMEAGPSAFRIRAFSPHSYKPIWKESKWALSGVSAGQLQTDGYIYVVTALIGLEALGILAAGRILFRPVGLLLIAWGRVALPQLAQAAGQRRYSDFAHILRAGGSVIIIVFLGVCGVIYVAWAPLQVFIYGDRYEGIGWIVRGWAAVTLVESPRFMLGIALQSLKQFKPLAFAAICGGIVSLLSLVVVIQVFGYKMSFVGILLGESVALLINLLYFCKEFQVLKR